MMSQLFTIERADFSFYGQSLSYLVWQYKSSLPTPLTCYVGFLEDFQN